MKGKEDKRLDSDGYSKARPLLDLVKKSQELSYNQKRTIWDKAVHGEVDEAWKMYETILTGGLRNGEVREKAYSY